MQTPAVLRPRRAGLLWLLATVTGGWALSYVRGHLYVPTDAAATVSAILANATIFRWTITAMLVSQVALLFLALELYRVFAPVEPGLARVLLVSMLASVTLACANQVPNLAALLVLGSDASLQAFTDAQRQTFVLMLLRVQNGLGQAVLEVFWVPFYTAFGLVALRTRALPRVLGVLLIAMGLGFAINLVDKLLVPTFHPVLFTRMAMGLGALGGIPTMLWLLIRGFAPPVRSVAAS